MSDDNKEVIRDLGGRFVKGQSGNPNGRPLGAKSRITKLKLSMEEALRQGLDPKDFKDIIRSMIEEAKGGNVQAAKLILDKVMPNARSEDESTEGDNRIVIKIENFTPQSLEKEVKGEIIDNEV